MKVLNKICLFVMAACLTIQLCSNRAVSDVQDQVLDVTKDVAGYPVRPSQSGKLNTQNLKKIRNRYPSAILFFPAGNYRLAANQFDLHETGIDWMGEPGHTLFVFDSTEKTKEFVKLSRVTNRDSPL